MPAVSTFGDIPTLDLVNDRIPILDASGTGTGKNKLISPGDLMASKLDLTGGTVTGQLVLTNASATGALNVSPVWNNGATDFAGIYGRITNTASGAASKLIDLGTVASGSMFSVNMSAQATCNKWIVAGTSSYLDANCNVAGAIITEIGYIAMNSAQTVLILRGSGSPEGAVTAGPGSLYLNSSGGAPYYKNTGTGNTGWVLLT